MEYLERGSLRPLLSTLALPQVIGVLEGLLAGLAHAHGRGTVHRDLKPENVLVAANGTVKIADFGIAKAFDSEIGNPLTLTGTTVGTPAYMAPEQAMAGEVGPAADLYAVGVMAYEMLAGELPFHGSDVPMAIMLQHLHDPVPPSARLAPTSTPSSATGSSGCSRRSVRCARSAPRTRGTIWTRSRFASSGRAGGVRAA